MSSRNVIYVTWLHKTNNFSKNGLKNSNFSLIKDAVKSTVEKSVKNAVTGSAVNLAQKMIEQLLKINT